MDTTREIAVCSITDDCYAFGCAALIQSVLDNFEWSLGYRIHFYVLHAGLAEDTKAKLSTICDTSSKAIITFVNMHQTEVYKQHYRHNSTAIPKKWELITLQLLVPYVLECHHRILYFDSDTIVVDSVHQLWELDLHDQFIAGVWDPVTGHSSHRQLLEKFGYPQSYTYFNTGVLVMCTTELIQQQLLARAESVIRKGEQEHIEFTFAVQDIFNIVCQNHWYQLPQKWNVFLLQIIKESPACPFESETLEDIYKHPSIVHYAGIQKPWNKQKASVTQPMEISPSYFIKYVSKTSFRME